MQREKNKEYQKTDSFKESLKRYRKTDKYKLKVPGYKSKQREYLRNLRKSVIIVLGGKCCKCEFNDIRALQIDHVNGGGNKERKTRNYKGNFHKHVLNSFLNNENKYQLLCANCNWIKRFENKEIKGYLTNS